jgi:D-tyrosyl-tRNA(Tyr) deacylase
MRAVIQRVTSAQVEVAQKIVGQINQGFLLLLGVAHDDMQEDADWLVKKISQMRIFSDEEGKMNKSLTDMNGEVLVVSQFTLQAKTKKGNRPSFIGAAPPDMANTLYEYVKSEFENVLNKPTPSGIFGANMQISLTNDGPVTIILDTKNKE